MTSFGRHAAVVAACVVVAVVRPPRAGAEGVSDRPVVTVFVDPCVDVQHGQIERTVEVELGVQVTIGDASPSTDATEATVTCDDDELVFRVNDPTTGKELFRRIDRSRVTEIGRDRLVALVVVELIAASWIELQTTPEPVVVAVGRSAKSAARKSARERIRGRIAAPDRWSKTLVAAVRISASGNSTSGGGGFRFTLEGPRHWGLAMDASFEERSESAGDDNLRDIDVASAALSAHGYGQAGWLRGRVGAGMRAGSARVPDVVQDDGLFVAAFARTGFAIELLDYLSIEASVEAAYALRPIDVVTGGGDSHQMDRLTLGAHAGIGASW